MCYVYHQSIPDLSFPQEPQKEQEAKPAGYSQKSVKDWDIDDVCGWLQGVGLGEH